MFVHCRQSVRPLLLAGIVLAAGCAASGGGVPAGSGEAYIHSYDLRPGSVWEFENSATTMIEMSGLMQASYSLEIGSVFSFRVDRRGRRGFLGIVEIESASMKGEAAGFLAPAGISPADVEGDLFDVVIGPRGGVEELSGRGVGPDRGGLINLESTLSGIFIPWPEGPVVPGHTWRDTTESENLQGGMNIRTTLIATYTYLGLEVDEEAGGTEPLHAVRRATASSSAGGGVVEGGEMDVSSTGSGEATFYFDTRDGNLVLARYTEEISSLTEVSGAMTMSMPVEIRSETVTRRIR
jgi:hypothetical protein